MPGTGSCPPERLTRSVGRQYSVLGQINFKELRQIQLHFLFLWFVYYLMIRNEAHYYQALNYIHINPVKHGYVKSPYDWIWSSLAIYVDEKGRDWLREQWEAHPPGDFGKRWDND